MDQPLAKSAGNALEVHHAIAHLTGSARDPRVQENTVALGAEMLLLGRLASDMASARAKIVDAIASGRAAERFARMVHALGGPTDLVEHPERHLAEAPLQAEVFAARPGFVQAIDTRALGLCVVKLGGGRTRPQDRVDHAVGLVALAAIGAECTATQPIAVVHARDESALREAIADVQRAYVIADAPVKPRPVILERIAP